MFHGFTKSKFYTKCNTLVKMTKTRAEALKKKKNSVIKYLKNDMADLIRTDLAYNAFCRAEGLLAELNMMNSYNFIEQLCGCISSNLSLMNKHKECPEECKEAVQSLIYAAARFSQFPELRDLRSIFIDRYGPPLEAFVSKELITDEQFVEMLKPKSTTKEMKLQLMHDIAQEFSIEWNSKSLEQKFFKPPPPPQQDQHGHEPSHDTDSDGYKPKKSKDDAFTKWNSLNDDDGYKWVRKKDDASTKRDSHDLDDKVNDTREHTFLERDERVFTCRGRKSNNDERYKLQSSSEDEVFSVSRRDSTDQDSLLASSSSVGSISEDELDSKKPISYIFIPPPYRITTEKKREIEETPQPNDKIAVEEANHQDDSIKETKTKSRSVRRRPSKPPPGHENFGSVERLLKPLPDRERVGSIESDGSARTKPSAMKQEEPRRGSRILKTDDDDDDERDEEEKVMDELLMHYSKKDSPHEPSKLSPHIKPPPPSQTNDDASKTSRLRSAISELPLPPGRASSLREPGTPTGATTRLGRAVSAQPDIMTGRVHPNLPDYDELAARIAALKGR